ncbi:hypothetical protein GCM10023322_30890 [Rugosimonospora acidiphila]|uniref:Uncharacterized protein n=1 Tax=Rugosimonospora acidiphila TaxID=556531 RepID=A0ABP9RSB0_9ACTN
MPDAYVTVRRVCRCVLARLPTTQPGLAMADSRGDLVAGAMVRSDPNASLFARISDPLTLVDNGEEVLSDG